MLIPIMSNALPLEKPLIENIIQGQERRKDFYLTNDEIFPEDLTEIIERIDILKNIKKYETSSEQDIDSGLIVLEKMSYVFDYYDYRYPFLDSSSLDSSIEAKYAFIKISVENPFDMILIYTHRFVHGEKEQLDYIVYVEWRKKPPELAIIKITEEGAETPSPEQFELEYGKTFRTYLKHIKEGLPKEIQRRRKEKEFEQRRIER